LSFLYATRSNVTKRFHNHVRLYIAHLNLQLYEIHVTYVVHREATKNYKFYMYVTVTLFLYCAAAPSGLGPPNYPGSTISFRHTTLGRTPLDELSARRRDLYLTTQNIHKRQTSTPPAEFELASQRPQTHALDRAATGIDSDVIYGILHTKINIYYYLF